jgi:alpha-galactosidase
MDLFPIVEEHIRQPGFWDDATAFAHDMQAHGQWFTSKGLIAYDFIRRYGVLGAAGDRHLAEFVPWYLTSEEDLNRYGVILTPSSYRLGTWRPPAGVELPPRRDDGHLRRSDEEAAEQLVALLGIQPLDTNVNLPNRGQIPGLPLGAVVETNAQFRHDSLSPVVPRPLPGPVLSLVRRVVEVQEMTLQAAMNKDVDLAFQALLYDPLCTIPVDRAWDMFCELLKANKAMLPGWAID